MKIIIETFSTISAIIRFIQAHSRANNKGAKKIETTRENLQEADDLLTSSDPELVAKGEKLLKKASKELSFETAGALKNGKHVWILASIKSGPVEVVKGDAITPYLLLTNGHDGNRAVSVGFTPIRVVCANTLAAAERDVKTERVRLGHSQQTLGNLEKVKEIINMANASFEASMEQYKFLASRKINQKDLEKFVKIVFPKDQRTERAKMAEEKILGDISRLFEGGMGQKIKGVKGTYWALYNATTEYLNYEVGKSNDSRMFNVWIGESKILSAKAMNLATTMAQGKVA